MKAHVTLLMLPMACIFACCASAQTFQAQITGDVRDASGSVAPNAKLTATNIATNATFETQSNEEGIYRFLALPPAQYKIAVSLTGFNRHISRALSAFDTPHQFIGSWVYQLPVGKGRRMSLSGPANTILGAWDLSGIVRVQSGQPVTINTPALNNGQSGKIDHPTIGRWFDTGVFRAALPFTFANIGPRSPDIRTDFTRNVDLVLVKKFPFTIKDREIVPQFRAECYNLSNTPQFAAPNGAVTSQQFGTVTRQANTSRQFQFGLKIAF